MEFAKRRKQDAFVLHRADFSRSLPILIFSDDGGDGIPRSCCHTTTLFLCLAFSKGPSYLFTFTAWGLKLGVNNEKSAKKNALKTGDET